jgi:hypothetical protein
MLAKMLAVCAATALTFGSTFARADTKDEVAAAAKKLAGDSYSWKSTTEGGQFGGSQEGKIQKDGLVWMSRTFGDNTIEIVKKGEQGAVKMQDGWQSLSEIADAEGPGRFIARTAQTFKAPAVQAQEIAEKLEKVEKSDDAYSATLTEEQVKSMATFGRRGGGAGGQAPPIKNAKGSAKFWVKDGALAKTQYTVSYTITIQDEDRDVNRTTTTEFKDVGNTKVEVPAEAKEKAKIK